MSNKNRRACMKRVMNVEEARMVCQDRGKWTSVVNEKQADLPDEEDKKSPVLLLGVSKIESPFVRRRSSDGAHTSGSIRFFRPPKSKYTRGHHGDERLEKIRQDLLTHKNAADQYIPNKRDQSVNEEEKIKVCIELDCVGNCTCKRNNSSNRGSFSIHRPNRQSSLCPSEPYGTNKTDCSENDIEFKYTEHIPGSQPSSSKQSSYNVTPKSTERRSLLLANLNERFRKTLSLDSRKVETNRIPLSLPKENRPKSLVNTANLCVQQEESFVRNKSTQPKKKRKSFFSLDTFFDKKSDSSSVDDYCSSKYKRFELDSDESPLFRTNRDKTPDLLKLPIIVDSVSKRKGDTRRQLEKLETHYYKSVKVSKTVVDAVPKDAKDVQGPSGRTNQTYDDDEVEYIEPIRSNFTSQSTLILDKNIPQDLQKPDSILTINTEETDIRLPSSTVSPKSGILDLDSIGAYEIEVKESDLLVDRSKNLTVKIMDKSVDSIGSCSLDVDASTDFSDTTSGSLNLLTPSSTTSRIRDFTSRLQERANHIPTPTVTNNGTPPKIQKYENLLKPPPKVVVNETHSHRSRGHHKKKDEHKKPSYLNLACSVNGYTNLTTYDSKLRQDINKSREASPIRPITHTYQYRTENSLLVPVPVSANKLLVPTFEPHDTRSDLTAKAPSKALTDPYLATSPLHVYMATENKQLKNDFLGANMTTTSRSYISSESSTFATSMLHQKDELDNVKEIKSSYSETNFRKTNGKGGVFSSESYTISSEDMSKWTEKTKKLESLNSESYTISSNGLSKRVEITKENGEKLTSPMKSFIQQRVERLYGPGALAQGFFNQKRYKTKSQCESEQDRTHTETIVSPKSSYELIDIDYSSQETDLSLPVLRHLRPEFRAQLPILSPKKSPKAETEKKDIPRSQKKINIPKSETEDAPVLGSEIVNGFSVLELVNTNSVVSVDSLNGEQLVQPNGSESKESNGCDVVKDGHYFLVLEKQETERLLALAATAEKELADLQNQEVSEEILGFLRSAAGKARLLATQKMQQFEGLCYNNINERDDAPFPTTTEDLQGFWDMVCLQVDNVNALYQHMAMLKENGWREISTPIKKKQPLPLSGRAPRPAAPAQPRNTKAKLAAEKRDADRKAMLEHRRRVARERQMAAKSTIPGSSHEEQQDMGIEGAQEVEIFVGRNARPSTVAPKGDCSSITHSNSSLQHDS